MPTLDAVCAYIWMKAHGYTKTPAEDIRKNLVFPELPISRIGKCYLASSMLLPETCTVSEDNLIRPNNWIAGVGKQDATFRVSATTNNVSYTRNFWVKTRLVSAPYVDFYVETDRFTDLCPYLEAMNGGFIGHKRDIGFGRIVDISAKKLPFGRAIVNSRGVPLRPLPADEPEFQRIVAESTPVEPATYYAPYWIPENQVPCFMPPPSAILPKGASMAQLEQNLASGFERRLEAAEKAKAKKIEKKTSRKRTARRKAV